VSIVESVVSANDSRKLAMAEKVVAHCGGSLKGKTVSVLGLTFKPNTDDMRDAPSLTIVPALQAAGATVRDASNKAWFVANLDTFGGNSGSGVYNQATKKLAGILVAGEVDYKPDTARGCYLLNLCPDNGCTGETVSRLSQVRMP